MTKQIETKRDEHHGSVDVGRRNLLKLTGVGVAALGMMSATETPAFAQGTLAWDKTFPKSDRVDHRKVTFNNRLGITLVADLYVAKTIDRSQRHPALVVGGPYGAVKEQSSGLYAQTMAERGYITIAHDPSYVGESGGQPHDTASAEALVEDFNAGVDFLGRLPFVDRERIGVLGVCGSGGFGLAAAEIDPRIKAVATVSMYDIGQANGRDSRHTWTRARSGGTSTRSRPNAGPRWMARSGRWSSERRKCSPRVRRRLIGVLRLLPHAPRPASALEHGVLAIERRADDAVLVVSASRLDLAAPGPLHHGRPGTLTHLQRARVQQGVGAEGTVHRSWRGTRRPLRPCQPHSLGQAPVVLRHSPRRSEGTIVMGRHAGSGVTAACAIAIAAVPLLTSCAKGTGMAATPQKGIHTSMLSHDDLASVSPALERYRREALEASLWKRPQLSPRDRSIVTIAALIARNQTAEQAHYLALALDNGVRPSEISEIITHLAFYAGWGNAMATVQIAQGVFDTRVTSPAQRCRPPRRRCCRSIRLLRRNAPPWSKRPWAPLRQVLWSTPETSCSRTCGFGRRSRRRDRSLVTVSALIASGQVAQVTYHLNRAMDSGLTQEEAGEVITHLAFYAGWPSAFSAVPVAKDVFDKRPR